MLAQQADAVSHEAAHRKSFFRQSGWLMIANVSGGFFMLAVHLLNKFIPPGQYGDFGVALAVVIMVPTIPLQMVLAQQTARALATNQHAELAGLIRWFWVVTTAVWLLVLALMFPWQHWILTRLQISSALFWITMVIVLISLWMPLFWGLLQGKQNFFWLGWSLMSNALGRFSVAAFAVLVLHAYAAGMIAGVLFGMVLAGVLGAWHSRSLWLAKPGPFDWRGLLAQVVPLFIGFLGFQVLFTADTIFVKAYFSKVNADFYVSSGTMSRGLMWLVLPLASVMFPRIVHSAAKSEKTNLMSLVLIGTAILAIAGAIVLSIVGPWIVPLVYSDAYVPVVRLLLPWYLFAMVPLAVANVLLNNLLARPAGMLLPALSILALSLGYLFALNRFHSTMVMVLQVMGLSNLGLLVMCAWFTWRAKKAGTLETKNAPDACSAG